MQRDATETFDRARVIVSEANPLWGDVPYTLQPGGCGQEGDYVHFTADYILKPLTSQDFMHQPCM